LLDCTLLDMPSLFKIARAASDPKPVVACLVMLE